MKACAGINFALMVFAMAVPLRLARINTLQQALLWLLASALSAYFGSLLANTLRISLAILLYHQSWSWRWIDAAELHRMEGVVVYFLCLWALYAILRESGDKALRRSSGNNQVKPEGNIHVQH